MAKTPCSINIANIYKETGKDMKSIQEMEEYVKMLQEAKPQRNELRGFIKQYAQDKGMELKSQYVNILDTLGKGVANVDRLNQFANDPKQGALSFFEETSSVVKGAGISVERVMQVKQKQFYGNAMDDMKKSGNYEAYTKGLFDKEVREYIRKGSLPEGQVAKPIKEIGDILKKHYSRMHKELNHAGLVVSARPDYDGPIVHGSTDIYGKFSQWVAAITDSLDYAGEFPILSEKSIAEFELLKRSGNIEENSVNHVVRIFKDAYDNITRSETGEVLSENKFMSISERRAKAKSFTKWKSGEAVQNYLNKFGKYKTLAEQFDYYSAQTARDVGLTSVLGASPSKGYEIIKQRTKELLTEKGIKGYALTKEMKDIDVAYRNLVESRAYNPNLIGKLFMTQRQLAAMAKLGWSGTTSFFLDPQSMSNQRRILLNEGLIKSTVASYGHYFASIKDAATLQDVETRYLFSQYQLGSTLEELQDMVKTKDWTAIASEMVSKSSGGYFSNKVSHIAGAKMWLKAISDGHLKGKLSKETLADLKKFNITTKDLDLVTRLDVKEYGMVNINNLNLNEFIDISSKDYADSDLAYSDMLDFKEKINGWLLERIRKSAPIPGARERRKLYGDTVAGTLEGEGRRYLGQFKSTALKQMTDMTIGAVRSINPEGPQTGVSFGKLRPTSYYAGRLALGLTAAGMSYMYLGAMLRQDEKALKRFDEQDPILLIEAFARGGGGFILNDMVKMNSNYLYNLGQLASPAATALAKKPANIGKAIKGDASGAIVDEIKTSVPGANLIWLTPFMEGFDDHASERARFNTKNLLN